MGGTELGEALFVGFGVFAEFTADEALAVANEPDFTTADGVDDGGGAEAFFGMGGEIVDRRIRPPRPPGTPPTQEGKGDA
jgi:hypothetical protein